MSDPAPKNSAKWKQDPEAVKADILAKATDVFTEFGFSGARVDEIVKRTRTSKRMIYYYFGDKRGLYQSVLEAAYEKLRTQEAALDLSNKDPIDALRSWVEFSFDYHRNNPDYVRLIAVENIHGGKHLVESPSIQNANDTAIKILREICENGADQKLFKSDIDPIELHWLITSSCVFNITNRASFKHLHGDHVFTDAGQESLKAFLVHSICQAVKPPTRP